MFSDPILLKPRSLYLWVLPEKAVDHFYSLTCEELIINTSPTLLHRPSNIWKERRSTKAGQSPTSQTPTAPSGHKLHIRVLGVKRCRRLCLQGAYICEGRSPMRTVIYASPCLSLMACITAAKFHLSETLYDDHLSPPLKTRISRGAQTPRFHSPLHSQCQKFMGPQKAYGDGMNN